MCEDVPLVRVLVGGLAHSDASDPKTRRRALKVFLRMLQALQQQQQQQQRYWAVQIQRLQQELLGAGLLEHLVGLLEYVPLAAVLPGLVSPGSTVPPPSSTVSSPSAAAAGRGGAGTESEGGGGGGGISLVLCQLAVELLLEVVGCPAFLEQQQQQHEKQLQKGQQEKQQEQVGTYPTSSSSSSCYCVCCCVHSGSSAGYSSCCSSASCSCEANAAVAPVLFVLLHRLRLLLLQPGVQDSLQDLVLELLVRLTKVNGSSSSSQGDKGLLGLYGFSRVLVCQGWVQVLWSYLPSGRHLLSLLHSADQQQQQQQEEGVQGIAAPAAAASSTKCCCCTADALFRGSLALVAGVTLPLGQGVGQSTPELTLSKSSSTPKFDQGSPRADGGAGGRTKAVSEHSDLLELLSSGPDQKQVLAALEVLSALCCSSPAAVEQVVKLQEAYATAKAAGSLTGASYVPLSAITAASASVQLLPTTVASPPGSPVATASAAAGGGSSAAHTTSHQPSRLSTTTLKPPSCSSTAVTLESAVAPSSATSSSSSGSSSSSKYAEAAASIISNSSGGSSMHYQPPRAKTEQQQQQQPGQFKGQLSSATACQNEKGNIPRSRSWSNWLNFGGGSNNSSPKAGGKAAAGAAAAGDSRSNSKLSSRRPSGTSDAVAEVGSSTGVVSPVEDPGSPVSTLVTLLGMQWAATATATLLAALAAASQSCATAMLEEGLAKGLVEVLSEIQDNALGAAAATACLSLVGAVAAKGSETAPQLLKAGITRHLLCLLCFQSGGAVQERALGVVVVLAGYGGRELLEEVVAVALLPLVQWLCPVSSSSSSSSGRGGGGSSSTAVAVAAAALLSAALDAGVVDAGALAGALSAAAASQDTGITSSSSSSSTTATSATAAAGGGSGGWKGGSLYRPHSYYGESHPQGALKQGVNFLVAHCMACLPLQPVSPVHSPIRPQPQQQQQQRVGSEATAAAEAVERGVTAVPVAGSGFVLLVAVRLLRALVVLEQSAADVMVELGGVPRLVHMLQQLLLLGVTSNGSSSVGGAGGGGSSSGGDGGARVPGVGAGFGDVWVEVVEAVQNLTRGCTAVAAASTTGGGGGSTRSKVEQQQQQEEEEEGGQQWSEGLLGGWQHDLQLHLVHEAMALIDGISLGHREQLVACTQLIAVIVGLLRCQSPQDDQQQQQGGKLPSPAGRTTAAAGGGGGSSYSRERSSPLTIARSSSSGLSSSSRAAPLPATASMPSLYDTPLTRRNSGGIGSISNSSGGGVRTWRFSAHHGVRSSSSALGLSGSAPQNREGLLLGCKVLACQLITVLAFNDVVKRQLYLEDAVGPLLALAEEVKEGSWEHEAVGGALSQMGLVYLLPGAQLPPQQQQQQGLLMHREGSASL